MREGLPNPQVRIQGFRVLSCSMPILLMMRKLSEAQRGKGLAWDMQRLEQG